MNEGRRKELKLIWKKHKTHKLRSVLYTFIN